MRVVSLVQMANWVGRFHVLVIHFPIALILFGAMVTFAKALLTGRSLFSNWTRFSKLGYYCILAGTCFAGIAATLGWLSGWGRDYGSPEMNQDLATHRILGTLAFAISVVASVWGVLFRKNESPLAWRLYLGFILASALLVSVTGHFGGVLVYGAGRFNWPP